ncbi:MAG: DUF484 family protein [Rickettsiales bacterium]|nr:DUF484 family protein [Rickettsiales bacterium]
MSSGDTAPKVAKSPTAEQVREFLKAHPDFLQKNSDVIADIAPPEQDLGNGIIDFQHYMLKNLQKDKSDLKGRYDVLVDFCRDNMSVQHQVHAAVLRLIRARSLEQLLEVVTLDLMSLFNVDVVRLAMESDSAGLYESYYNGDNYSGIVFIPHGIADIALGKKKNVLLVDDCAATPPAGFDEIFSDCEQLIVSCAILRLELEQVNKHVLLAFGVRHKSRFHQGQGIELLNFLAQIVAHQLDLYLQDLDE